MQPPKRETTLKEMKRAIPLIQKRIDELRAFSPESISKRGSAEATALETAIAETLGAAFGHRSVRYNRYSRAASLDHGPIIMGAPEPIEKVRQYLTEGRQSSITLLEHAIRSIEEELSHQESSEVVPQLEAVRDMSKVFVVHGHNGEVSETVARFISERLGLESVILHERPDKGRTIITKFREEAVGVGFAVVLMTADNLGKANNAPDLNPRARQNIVFELGFFIGALGPERVAAIVKGDIERPSDFDGVVYISFDNEDWRAKLGRELQAAGYNIDWNRVMETGDERAARN